MKSMKRIGVALFVVSGLVVSAASMSCSDATGHLVGGDPEPLIADVAQCANPDAATSNTWSFLYDCYFGPTGHASCSAQALYCHASPTDTGAFESGFVCGESSDSCYFGMRHTMISGGNILVRQGGPNVNPEDTYLFNTIHKTTGIATDTANNMPAVNIGTRETAYTFTPADLDWISSWIQAGAKND